MTKEREPKKPKVVWVGGTPITPITAEQKREIQQRIRERREKLRQRYPEVHGRAVDCISHSIEDGSLFFTVAFKDKTTFSAVSPARCSSPEPTSATCGPETWRSFASI